MVIAANFSRRHDYVLSSDADEPKERQTVFRIKTLPAGVLAEVIDLMTPYLSANVENLMEDVFNGKFALAPMVRDMTIVCCRTLGGWSNFNDEDGKPIAFEEDDSGEVKEEILKANLDFPSLFELAQAGLLHNRLGDNDKKK